MDTEKLNADDASFKHWVIKSGVNILGVETIGRQKGFYFFCHQPHNQNQ